LLGIDNPLLSIAKVVITPEPSRLGLGDDSLHRHPAAKVEMAFAKRDDVDDVSDRYAPLAKAVAAR